MSELMRDPPSIWVFFRPGTQKIPSFFVGGEITDITASPFFLARGACESISTRSDYSRELIFRESPDAVARWRIGLDDVDA